MENIPGNPFFVVPSILPHKFKIEIRQSILWLCFSSGKAIKKSGFVAKDSAEGCDSTCQLFVTLFIIMISQGRNKDAVTFIPLPCDFLIGVRLISCDQAGIITMRYTRKKAQIKQARNEPCIPPVYGCACTVRRGQKGSLQIHPFPFCLAGSFHLHSAV